MSLCAQHTNMLIIIKLWVNYKWIYLGLTYCLLNKTTSSSWDHGRCYIYQPGKSHQEKKLFNNSKCTYINELICKHTYHICIRLQWVRWHKSMGWKDLKRSQVAPQNCYREVSSIKGRCWEMRTLRDKTPLLHPSLTLYMFLSFL